MRISPVGRRGPGGAPRRSPPGAAFVLAALAAGCAGRAAEVRLDPLVVPAPGSFALAPVAFLAGCWQATVAGGGTVEERWSLPAGGLMLGWSRTLAPGRPARFEHLRVEAVGADVLYRPAPSGTPSEHDFRLTTAAPGEVAFEAPEHDFPKRIRYRMLEGGGLWARVDGGEGSDRGSEWTFAAVECP